jgi:hypothetical protein
MEVQDDGVRAHGISSDDGGTSRTVWHLRD